MNRIDRLTAILIQLQSKHVTKAKEIADRFSISLRTVYRDIRALEEAGVPIGAEAGVGYFLVSGYNLPPVMFTKEEANAMIMAEKLMQKFSDKTLSKQYTSAMYKIRSVLASADKDHLTRLENQIEVFQPMENILNIEESSFLSQIQDCLGKKKVIRITYQGMNDKKAIPRNVEPIGICYYANHWHLIAYCRLREDYRDFRIDRISSIELTKTIFSEKHQGTLRDLIKKLMSSQQLYKVTIRFDKSLESYLNKYKYLYGFLEEKKIDSWIECSFYINSYEYFAKWLLGLGEKADIIAPEKLIQYVFKLSNKLHEQYTKKVNPKNKTLTDK